MIKALLVMMLLCTRTFSDELQQWIKQFDCGKCSCSHSTATHNCVAGKCTECGQSC